jgi:hypothetical protein
MSSLPALKSCQVFLRVAGVLEALLRYDLFHDDDDEAHVFRNHKIGT